MLGAYENWVETAPKQATCVTLFLYFWIEHLIFYMRNIWCKLLHRGGFNKVIIVKNNSMYILIWLVLGKPNCYKNSNNWSYIIWILTFLDFLEDLWVSKNIGMFSESLNRRSQICGETWYSLVVYMYSINRVFI